MPIPVLNKLTQQAGDIDPAELFEALRSMQSLGRFEAFGHSYPVGSLADPDRDVMTRLASMLGPGVLEVNRAIGGAIGGWHSHDTYGTAGNGGIGTVMQNHVQNGRLRPSGTVSAVGSPNTSVFTMTTLGQQYPWAANQRICYVRQSDGSQVIRDIKSVNQATQPQILTLYTEDPLPWAATIGDRVFEVPTHYQPLVPWALLWIGIHDLVVAGTAEFPSGTAWGKHQGKHLVTNAVRSMVAYLLCAEAFDANHASVEPGNGAPAAALNPDPVGAIYGNYTIGPLSSAAPADTITLYVPPNFPGGSVHICFVAKEGTTSASRGGGTVDFTVDGSGAGSLECRWGMYTDPLPDQKLNAFTKTIKNLAPGAHKIVCTIGNSGVHFFFNYWGIEGYPDRTQVILPGPSRLKSYHIYGAGYEFQRVKGTVTGTNNAPTDTFTITAATKDVDGTDTTFAIQADEFITFDPGGANEEVLEVAADVAPGGTTVTTKTTSTRNHNAGETYEANVGNKRLHQVKTWWQDIANEFAPTDGRPNPVKYIDADAAIHNGEFPAFDADAFLGDSAHLNNLAAKRVAKAVYEALESSPAVDLDSAAWNAMPTAPLPGQVTFIQLAAAAAPPNPGGANAMVDAYPLIHPRVDLRRCRYARLLIRVPTLSTGATFGKVEFKDVAGTWRSLGMRESVLSGTHNNVVLEPGHVSVGAGPPAGSASEVNISYGERGDPMGWFYVNPLVWLVKDVELRYVHGNRTVTTTPPSYSLILLQFQ